MQKLVATSLASLMCRPMRHGHGCTGGCDGRPCTGPMRRWSASSAPSDLSVRQKELRRPLGHRPDLDSPLHEDNWLDSQRITGSFDALAGKLKVMFNFKAAPDTTPYILNTSTAEPTN